MKENLEKWAWEITPESNILAINFNHFKTKVLNVLFGEKELPNPKLDNMPESWAKDPELMKRYLSLMNVIEENQEWWNEWKNKIEIKSDRIDLKDNFRSISLSLKDEEEKQNLWNWAQVDLEKCFRLPSINSFEVITKFMLSAWEENYLKLRDFLWFKGDSKYWISELVQDSDIDWYFYTDWNYYTFLDVSPYFETWILYYYENNNIRFLKK